MPVLGVDIETKLAQFQDSMGAMAKAADRTSKQINSAFSTTRSLLGGLFSALTVRAAVQSFQGLVDAAEQVGARVQKLGIGAEALQTLEFAAKQSEVAVEDLDKGLLKFSVALTELRSGSGEAGERLASLGFAAKDFEGLKTDEAFLKLATRIASFSDGASKAAANAKIFGREVGPNLIPLLNKGAEGIKELQQEGLKLGGIFSGEFVSQADKFNDQIHKIGLNVKDIALAFSEGLLPVLLDISVAFTSTRDSARGLAETGESFGEILRTISVLGTGTAGVLRIIGNAAAGLAASASAAARAQFGEALAILQNIKDERDRIARETFQTIEALQTKTGPFVGPPEPTRIRPPAPLPFGDTKSLGAAIKALAGLEEARAKAIAEGEKRLADQRLEILERFHAEGLISERDFWETRNEIQTRATQASIAAINVEIEARRASIARLERESGKARKPAERDEAQAKIIGEQKELEDALNRVSKLEQELGFFRVKGALDAAKATETYKDEVTRLTAEMLELQGETRKALDLRLQLDTRGVRRQAETRGDQATLALIESLNKAKSAQGEFNKERKAGQDIIAELAIQEERIQNTLKVGAITELESLAQTDDARKNAVARLQSISSALKRVAEESGLPDLILQAKQFEVQLESLAASADLFVDKFKSIGETALGDLFSDIVTGSKSAKEAFNDFAKSITDQVTRLVSQNLSRKLFNAIMGEGTGGQNLLADAIRGLFGVGGGGGASALGGLNLSSFGPAFQHGGSFTVGGAGGVDSKLVAFRASPGERVQVTPPGVSGGNVIHINVNGNADQRTAQQIGNEVARALSRANRRNG